MSVEVFACKNELCRAYGLLRMNGYVPAAGLPVQRHKYLAEVTGPAQCSTCYVPLSQVGDLVLVSYDPD